MKKLMKGFVLGLCLMCVLVWTGIRAVSQESAKQGDGSKYGKYVLTDEMYRKIDHYTGTSIVARDSMLGPNISMCYHTLVKPINFDKPHHHDFREILCFIGGNPLDITDFDAVIEYTINGEKHVISKPVCVTMPPGLEHCPISVKNVSTEKPIVFLEISLSGTYEVVSEKKE
jgi:hypothetical protein